MFADTKAVRRILRTFNVKAHWTDKSAGNKNKNVRIIVAEGFEQDYKGIKQVLSDVGYTNRVTFTQGLFIRIKTYMA